jgi:hypothetical protein
LCTKPGIIVSVGSGKWVGYLGTVWNGLSKVTVDPSVLIFSQLHRWFARREGQKSKDVLCFVADKIEQRIN